MPGAFPSQRDRWCTADGTYYIAAMDYYDYQGQMYDENWDYGKDIVLIAVNNSQYVGEPFITDTRVNGTLFIWNNGWDLTANLSFPVVDFYIGGLLVVPITYNDYAEMEDLLETSITNVLEMIEGAELLNITISHHERYVTVIQEMFQPMPWYNGEYIVNGYYYGVQYDMELYISGGGITVYVQMQIVAECNTGIPLYQGMIMGVFLGGTCVTAMVYNMKTMATSVELPEV